MIFVGRKDCKMRLCTNLDEHLGRVPQIQMAEGQQPTIGDALQLN